MPVDDHARAALRKLSRLAAIALAATSLIAAALVGSAWIWAWISRRMVRDATVAFLWSVVASELATALLAPVALLAAIARLRQARRARRPWQSAGKAALLSASLLLGLACLELAATATTAFNREPPTLPEPIVPEGSTPSPIDASDAAIPAIRIVVIGESSARGEPYHPWLSVGQIVAWQLGRVFPDRKVEVDMRAEGGLDLEQAVSKLRAPGQHPPDAVLVYAGHNEFQARYGWDRTVAHYRLDRPVPSSARLLDLLARVSPLSALARDALERHKLDAPPPKKVTRALVDVPAYTPDEYARLLASFQERLEAVVAYCEAIKAVPILVIPAGNDGDYPPIRSYLSPDAPRPARLAFARDFLAARALESSDPLRALDAYASLVHRDPTFAEAHYRLAQALERAGRLAQARPHYLRARDLDGLPMRCPSDFQQAYHNVAARHLGVVLVDGQAVLSRLSPRGLPDASVIHDAQHPGLKGYAALARAALDGLRRSRAFDWPAEAPTPTFDDPACADHFRLDSNHWRLVCRRTSEFYERTAYLRHDPSESLAAAARYRRAAEAINAGTPPAATGLPILDLAAGPDPDPRP